MSHSSFNHFPVNVAGQIGRFGSMPVKYLTNSMRPGLTAVVKERHVSQTVTVIYVAAALQDLRHRKDTEQHASV